MKTDKDDSTPKMATLSETSNEALLRGYTENFKVVSKGLATEDEKFIYTPEDVTIPSFFRFEGYSDPQDSAILYLIRTNDDKKGILIDAYGAYADAKLSEFIRKVEDIQKKAHKHNRLESGKKA